MRRFDELKSEVRRRRGNLADPYDLPEMPSRGAPPPTFQERWPGPYDFLPGQNEPKGEIPRTIRPGTKTWPYGDIITQGIPPALGNADARFRVAGDIVPLPIAPGVQAGQPTGREMTEGIRQDLPRIAVYPYAWPDLKRQIRETPRGPRGRQYGGPVEAQQPYRVGEAGPEVFVPDQPSTYWWPIGPQEPYMRRARRESYVKPEENARRLAPLSERDSPLGRTYRGIMPGRQTGGAVEPGKPYRVGEAGPETFVPDTMGRMHELQKRRLGVSGAPSELDRHLGVISGVARRAGSSEGPLVALSKGVPTPMLEWSLGQPGHAASIAAWSRAYERIMRDRTPGATAQFNIATRNLNNTLGTNISPDDILGGARGKPVE
jgi:SLT domain-containing protein